MEYSQNEHILELIKKGNNKALEEVYNDNRNKFINFARKFNLSREDALDVYQDSIIDFKNNISLGKILTLNCAISTYLFGIGKNRILAQLKKNSKYTDLQHVKIQETNEILDVNLIEEKLTNQQKLIKNSLSNLGNRCKEILTLFYIEGYDLDEITEILNYSTKKVLKSQKSRCKKQLKEMIFK